MAVLQVYTSGQKSTESTEKNAPNVQPESVAINSTDTPTEDPSTIAPLHDRWIDFCAVGGMIVADDGTVKPTTVKAFADSLGVSRETLYYWKKSIPDFKERVKARMREIGGEPQKLAKAWNGIWLKTCAGNAEAGKLYFANFDPEFKMPTQKVEDDRLGLGLAELMELAKQRRLESAMEGEVVKVYEPMTRQNATVLKAANASNSH